MEDHVGRDAQVIRKPFPDASQLLKEFCVKGPLVRAVPTVAGPGILRPREPHALAAGEDGPAPHIQSDDRVLPGTLVEVARRYELPYERRPLIA